MTNRVLRPGTKMAVAYSKSSFTSGDREKLSRRGGCQFVAIFMAVIENGAFLDQFERDFPSSATRNTAPMCRMERKRCVLRGDQF